MCCALDFEAASMTQRQDDLGRDTFSYLIFSSVRADLANFDHDILMEELLTQICKFTWKVIIFPHVLLCQ